MAGGAAAALASPVILRWPANAAEFEFKVGNNLPVLHPMNVRLSEAVARIKEESGGQVAFQIFPSNVLGGDTEMLSQLRSGALEFFLLSGGILSTLIPVTGIYNTGFVFKDYHEVWSAMDGSLGSYLRAVINKSNLHAMSKLWNNGFRQVTSSVRPIHTPDDLRGFKIRVAVSRIYVSLFKNLGASPTSLNFSELYSALQTRVFDGEENALVLIDSAKLFEVQKYVSLTNHAWDGFFMLSNGQAWRQLGGAMQDVVSKNFDQAALEMRDDTMKLDQILEAQLKAKGMSFNDADSVSFREKLRTSGFYAEWKSNFGADAWAVLESAVGQLT